jgi:hypothetical protein
MTRTGELMLLGVSITVLIVLIISQTIWIREQDKPSPSHDLVMLGDANWQIPANQPLSPVNSL